jgi:hypothetical protein
MLNRLKEDTENWIMEDVVPKTQEVVEERLRKNKKEEKST